MLVQLQHQTVHEACSALRTMPLGLTFVQTTSFMAENHRLSPNSPVQHTTAPLVQYRSLQRGIIEFTIADITYISLFVTSN